MSNDRWTAPLVEERLAEAAGVLKRLPEEKVQGYFSAWPDVVHNIHESFGWHDPVLRRPWPSPGSIDRMDETMQWLQWLEPDVAKICWFRAAGERWKTICTRVGLQRTAVHQRYLFGHCVIAWKLNGRRLPRNCSRRKVIEMVQSAKA
ncbi:MAG: DUF6362 family protein [Terasakiella sp.]|uniref:DUF6362 family protein n=1 Tax=unclassified Terasakiella TaxID=2614952 RepID=UPI000C93B2E2|nr:hypothetical protein [Rhodospirillaceae bacterium]|tara:strand:- start:180 stop:623 length:444 start_codon:yes stop_codon:yes gene_type:complete